MLSLNKDSLDRIFSILKTQLANNGDGMRKEIMEENGYDEEKADTIAKVFEDAALTGIRSVELAVNTTFDAMEKYQKESENNSDN